MMAFVSGVSGSAEHLQQWEDVSTSPERAAFGPLQPAENHTVWERGAAQPWCPQRVSVVIQTPWTEWKHETKCNPKFLKLLYIFILFLLLPILKPLSYCHFRQTCIYSKCLAHSPSLCCWQSVASRYSRLWFPNLASSIFPIFVFVNQQYPWLPLMVTSITLFKEIRFTWYPPISCRYFIRYFDCHRHKFHWHIPWSLVATSLQVSHCVYAASIFFFNQSIVMSIKKRSLNQQMPK